MRDVRKYRSGHGARRHPPAGRGPAGVGNEYQTLSLERIAPTEQPAWVLDHPHDDEHQDDDDQHGDDGANKTSVHVVPPSMCVYTAALARSSGALHGIESACPFGRSQLMAPESSCATSFPQRSAWLSRCSVRGCPSPTSVPTTSPLCLRGAGSVASPQPVHGRTVRSASVAMAEKPGQVLSIGGCLAHHGRVLASSPRRFPDVP